MLIKNRNIISALIGLVGAVSNGGKTENTDYIIKIALASEDTDEMAESPFCILLVSFSLIYS